MMIVIKTRKNRLVTKYHVAFKKEKIDNLCITVRGNQVEFQSVSRDSIKETYRI